MVTSQFSHYISLFSSGTNINPKMSSILPPPPSPSFRRSVSLDGTGTEKADRLARRKKAMIRRAASVTSYQQFRGGLSATCSDKHLDEEIPEKNARWESRGSPKKQDRSPRSATNKTPQRRTESEKSRRPGVSRWNSEASLGEDKAVAGVVRKESLSPIPQSTRRSVLKTQAGGPPSSPCKQPSFELPSVG